MQCRLIREVAAEKGLTAADLARKSGVSYRLVHEVMHERAHLRDETLGRLALALGVRVGYLLTGEETRKPIDSVSQSLSAMVREGAADNAERSGELDTVEAAITFLARQFEVSREDLREALLKFLLEKEERT